MGTYRYYTKNARRKVSRSEYLGATPENKSNTAPPPNCEVHKETYRKCHHCSIVLKDMRQYIITNVINQDVQAECFGCYVP